MQHETDRRDVVVLGAGPAGLAAAWYAARRGLSVTVIDRASCFGGLAGSIIVDGQSVDLGSHRLHPSIDPEVLADLRDELGLELQWRPRNGRIRLQGRWLAFPLQPGDLLRHARPSFASRALFDIAASPGRRLLARRASGVDSFSRQVRLGLGPTIGQAFYEPYARKLWALDGDRLSAELFRRRVGARSASSIARDALRPRRPRGFWYPVRGFGEICDAIARGIADRGGVVALSTSLDSVDLGGDAAVLRVAGGGTILATTLISTIPPADLARLVGAPRSVSDAADSLETRAAVLVYLSVPRSQYTTFDAHYFPEPSTIVSRLSEPKNYRASAADPEDRTVLCAEIPATLGDDVWNADDDEIARRVCVDLAREGLPDPSPSAIAVERRTHVYPVYRIGFERQRAIVEDHLAAQPRLAVLGRQALFAHDNTHHALLMGRTVVEALGADGRLDVTRWRSARATFADHVVED